MNQQIRVRFAPSPTGFLHIGGLRTLLFNYLFAAHHKGSLILRIEDTDQKRKVVGAFDKLLKIIDWSGLHYAEGPDIGGNYGPYMQSERLHLYKKYVDQLLQDGHAYRCFCTPETLQQMRQQQIKMKLNPKYDGRCRALKLSEIEDLLVKNRSHVIRLRIKRTKANYIFEDLIRGQVSISAKQVDDQVLLKSDGYPTYHLANVVDDHLMKISHVIRGEEWLSSVPKHLQLYDYLGWEKPYFAHIPLLLNSDRSKLSKRQHDVAVEDYRDNGYNREGLLNFISLLGWNSKSDRELFSLADLVERFSLEDINKSGAVVDKKKLMWFSNQHFMKQNPAEIDTIAIDYYPAHIKQWSAEKRIRAIQLILPSLSYLKQLPQLLAPLVLENNIGYKNPIFADQNIDKSLLAKVASLFIDHFEQIADFDQQQLKLHLKQLLKTSKLQPKEFFNSLRIMLTGQTSGIELAAVIDFHGLKTVITHLRHFV